MYELQADYPRSVFKSRVLGFGALEIDADKLSVILLGLDGKAIHRQDLLKPQEAQRASGLKRMLCG